MNDLSLRGVSKRHGRVVALDAVDLDVAGGHRLAILGPSGSGKTTLLRLVAGFDVPDVGRISLGETLLANGSHAVPAHRRGIGYVAQDGALFPHLTVAENVAFGLDRKAPGRSEAVGRLLRLVELDPALGPRKPDSLSGGQQQRVAVARALAQRPGLMLLDEPFSSLDTSLRASTREAVGDLLREAGITTVLVTHDRAEALSFADHIAVLLDGRLLQVGPPHEVYLRPRDRAVAELLGETIVLCALVSGGRATCALGLVPVAAGGMEGLAEIVLRPEQIQLAPSGELDWAGRVAGRVVDIRFVGPQSTVRVALADPASHGACEIVLARETPSVSGLAVGSEVAIFVIGDALSVARGA